VLQVLQVQPELLVQLAQLVLQARLELQVLQVLQERLVLQARLELQVLQVLQVQLE